MCACDIARNGESKTDAAGLQIAAFVQAMERPERFLSLAFRNAGSVVVHNNLSKAFVAHHGHADVLSVLQCVVDKIGDTAPQRTSPSAELHRFWHIERKPIALRHARPHGSL